MKEVEEKKAELVEAVKKGLEAETDYTLNEQEEDYAETWLHIYRIKEKKPSHIFVPIEVCFNTIRQNISLIYEESYGLIETGDETIKGIAKWFRKYADYMEARHKQFLNLGYRQAQKHIDGIHHIDFHYQKDFTYNQIQEVVKEAKNLIEEVWAFVLIL